MLDLWQNNQAVAARPQPGEGQDLPATFGDTFDAAWHEGQLFSSSAATENAHRAAVDSYVNEVKQLSGQDIRGDVYKFRPFQDPTAADLQASAQGAVAKIKQERPDLQIPDLTDEELNRRAVAASAEAHKDYVEMSGREKTFGGKLGSFLGSTASATVDPINLIGLAAAPEAELGTVATAALWGGIGAGSQAVNEVANAPFRNQVQPGYLESDQPAGNILEAGIGGAALGGVFKAIGSIWTRMKTGEWPRSVRDAGNIVESEANIQQSNPFAAARSPEQQLIDAAVPSDPSRSVVFVDASKVDGMLKSIDRTYVEPKRTNAKEFIDSQPEEWNPPHLNARTDSRGNDRVEIIDGIHRWAAMRDKGMSVVPVEMDAAAAKKAQQMGLLKDKPTAPDPVEGEAAHREALSGAIDNILNGRGVDVDTMMQSRALVSSLQTDRSLSLPIMNEQAIRLTSEEAGLNERSTALRNQLAGLPEGDLASADRLNRLQAVEQQIAGTTDRDALRALNERRDQILVDTTPEQLRAGAAPFEQRRQIEAEQSAIGTRLADIQKQRAAMPQQPPAMLGQTSPARTLFDIHEGRIDAAMAQREAATGAAEAARAARVETGELPFEATAEEARAEIHAGTIADSIAAFGVPKEEAAALAQRVIAAKSDDEARAILNEAMARPQTIADTVPSVSAIAKAERAERAAQAELPPALTQEDRTSALTDPNHEKALNTELERLRDTGQGGMIPMGVDEKGEPTYRLLDEAIQDAANDRDAAEQIEACINPPVEEAAE